MLACEPSLRTTLCKAARDAGSLLRHHAHMMQGEVEQISMMKPKAVGPHEGGMLEYLEDIIGTERYVPQIEAGAKRCAAAAASPHLSPMLCGTVSCELGCMHGTLLQPH